MNIVRLLPVVSILFFAALPAEAAEVKRLSVTVQLDSTKDGGLLWDHAPTGSAPDPQGSIAVGGYKQEIPVQENTFIVVTEFHNIQMNVGDAIMFDLADRDRGRLNDVIARGSVPWNGQPVSTYRLGFATITVKAEFSPDKII